MSEPFYCRICGYTTTVLPDYCFGMVRGNTARFLPETFRLCKCPACKSIFSLTPVEYADIYRDYPLNNTHALDYFNTTTYGNLIRRLVKAGVSRSHSILDYGCGNGVFLEALARHGFNTARGFDPFVARFSEEPQNAAYDCVVCNDVLEHVDDPRGLITRCKGFVKPGGILYIGTSDSEPVDMRDLGPHILRLHQPFHRVMVTARMLHTLARECGVEIIASYRRSYIDTHSPFVNYRFFDELNRALGYNLDRMFTSDAGAMVSKKPQLLFFAMCGYWFPSAYEPAVVVRVARSD